MRLTADVSMCELESRVRLRCSLDLQPGRYPSDPPTTATYIQTQMEQLDALLGEERSLATLLSIFGALAVVMASIGLYGTMRTP